MAVASKVMNVLKLFNAES